MAEMDYAGVLPTAPPEGLVPWLLEKGDLSKELLIYRAEWYRDPLTEQKEQMAKLTCTACKSEVLAEKVSSDCCHGAYSSAVFGFVHPETKEILRSGEHCLCPECGAPVQILHVGNVTENLTCVESYPLTVSRFEDKLVLTGWCVRKWFQKDGTSGITVWPYEAYVAERKGIVRLSAYVKFMSSVRLSGEWTQRKRYYDNWGKTALVYPLDPKLLIGSTAENSKLDRFLKASKKDGTYPVTYLRLWQKHPNIENLVMQGASRLLAEAVDNERRRMTSSYYRNTPVRMPKMSWINWKQNSPSRMLGMTKDEYKACLQAKWDVFTLKFWQEEKEAGRTLTMSDMELVQSFGTIRCTEVRNVYGLDYLKCARYLQKQKKRDKRCDFHILQDYWRIAKDTGSDMSLPEVQFPPRLMAAHDRVERTRQWQEAAKKATEREARRAQFEERYQQLLSLAWEQDGILIRPARDEEELKREGDKLSHCVGSYAKSHAEGRTAIFLIRRADEPDKPWYTLELNEKTLTVSQNRGKQNCARTKEITAFELRWIAWCREQAGTTKKKRRARQRVAVPA